VSQLVLAQSLAAQAAQPTGGGTAWLLPLMLVAMVLLLWLPMRRQKKAMAQMKEKQSTMMPGTDVMTNFGLYGTVRAIDRDANKADLEIAPGTVVTVHLQTLTTVVEEQAPAEQSAAAAPEARTESRAETRTDTRSDAADELPGSTAAEHRDDEAPREPGQRND
jgi:preprotein translocase subunit YajC